MPVDLMGCSGQNSGSLVTLTVSASLQAMEALCIHPSCGRGRLQLTRSLLVLCKYYIVPAMNCVEVWNCLSKKKDLCSEHCVCEKNKSDTGLSGFLYESDTLIPLH